MAIPVITEGEINAVKKNAAHARRIGKADSRAGEPYAHSA